MPLLSLTIGNIIKFFTFLSPIFISSFLVLQSFVNYDLKALAYLIGTLLAYGIGMLVKLFFHHNPAAEDMIADSNKKILLYTDIETQTMLAKNKNAWVYCGLSIEEMELKEIKKTTKFNNNEVFYKVDEIAKYTDYQIYLQDVVATQGQALLDIFGSTINQNNVQHNNMWLNLHTNEEKGLLSNES